jgi:predicted esterase
MPDRHDPHQGQPVLHHGTPLADARLVAILLHGRGASAHDMFGLAAQFATSDVAYIAPEAAGQTWYPYSFMSPLARNEPHLGSALRRIATLVDGLEGQGVSRDRIVLMGFSQGACLALEFAARQAGRYAGIVGLSGGLIGPPGTPRRYTGGFAGAPVFLGCSDIDPHVPVARVRESAATFRDLGATVDERIYEGMSHTVNRDELDAVTALLRSRTTT